MVTSMVASSQVAKLQGIGVLVGVYIGVLVGIGVLVDVGALVTAAVGEARFATRVSSAMTVCAAWVNTASVGIEVAGLMEPGKEHAVAMRAIITSEMIDFFIKFFSSC
jgi:hypothetical protein